MGRFTDEQWRILERSTGGFTKAELKVLGIDWPPPKGWRKALLAGRPVVVDHIKPRSKYPKLELEASNLQVLCNNCNMGKSNKHQDDFRPQAPAT